jgi:YbbR domain-containing protein
MSSGARLPEANARILTQHDITDLVPVRTGVQLVDVKPDSIYVEFDRYDERVFPVVLDIAASFREGYGQVGAATVTPESVTVGGAASNIRVLHSWKTVRSTFDDLRAPVDADIPLVASTTPPLVISPPLVHVSINVQPFAEKVLNGIPIEGVGVPSNREIIFIPPKIELVARAGIKQLASLVAADFHARIDHLSILTDTTGMVDPIVTGPPGIQIVSKHPERLQYIVRKRL